MFEIYQVFGLVFALVLLVLDFYLLRKRKLSGKGFVLWFIIGVTIGLLSMVPPLLSLIYILIGTELWLSAFMSVGFAFFLLAIFYLYYRVSELHSLLVKLAMELSVAKYSQEQSSSSDPEPKKRKTK